ncbi:bifunctional hydroxymethylpyrimidine kinase/phosphomethylpyrimidine kinase [Paracoccus sp. p3-h83]|uniref:bifunctional hydroxymethylpyrimidine kinase/phosphomethylpyrimidine kinase n=1 Tax=Paracoccus sp. p3-h83 TaxID=3342805 RepID=UPI0035B7F5C3
MIANILAIAGSDPSGGAGIQADIKAISANGGYAMAAITALTVQNTQGVRAVSLVDPGLVADQIAAIRDDIRIDAVKIGMLGSAPIAQAVARALRGLAAPIVLDPVMVATSGDRLLADDAVAALRGLFPQVALLTPNVPEAAALLGTDPARDVDQMAAQGRALTGLGLAAVLMKGGHLPGSDCTDLLVGADGSVTRLDGARHPTRHTHGTGCTLSSALATHLGRGLPLAQAAARAKAHVAVAIAGADALDVGNGRGPTHHFAGLLT